MKYLFTILLVCSSLVYSIGCGNEYGHSIDGEMIHTRYVHFPSRVMTFDKSVIQKRLDKLKTELSSGTENFKTWSDIALNLMKLGDADSSVKLLRPLVNKHPTEYNLLANLGTAYELTDQLDSALKYISLGFEKNPKSHRGTEWVHVLILEAKIKAKNRQDWMMSNEIITVALLKEKEPSGRRGNDEVNRAIMYQLHTRAPFTPAPNKVMANILESLGDYNAKYGAYENAILAYAYALNYQSHSYIDRRIKKKIGDLNKLRSESEINEWPHEFSRLIQRANIDPELMAIGLGEFANHVDSTNRAVKEHELIRDSLGILKKQLDSLKSVDPKEEESPNVNQSFTGKVHWVYFVLVLLLGAILVFVLNRKK